MLTVRQLAKTGVLTENAIRLLLKQKRLPAVYIGKKALIPYESVITQLQSVSVANNEV